MKLYNHYLVNCMRYIDRNKHKLDNTPFRFGRFYEILDCINNPDELSVQEIKEIEAYVEIFEDFTKMVLLGAEIKTNRTLFKMV